MRAVPRRLVAVAMAAAAACSCQERPPPEAPGRSDAAPPAAAREALSATAEFIALPVPDHTPAVVSVPLGASTRRPVLVATHGAGDRAEWHCEFWSAIVKRRGFVLCPQGRRIDNRVPHRDSLYYYPDHHVLDRELVAALAALGERFPEHADISAAVYAGFSQGAIFGALIVTKRAGQFPRAILVEGGHGAYQEWTQDSARAFARRGGKRLLFGCGGRWCVQNARGLRELFDRAGIESRVANAEGAGHSLNGPMEPELRDGFDWIVADDPRWRVP